METIAEYFEQIPSLHRGLILAGGIALFWIIEDWLPSRTFEYHKWRHAGINIFFTATTIAVNFALAFVLLMTARWCETNTFGLLYLVELNPWISMLVGLLLLDFIGAYLAHYIQHKNSWMWRFHLIHHTDTWVDTTSANRHHPGESVVRFAMTVLAVFVTGAPMWMVFLYQSLSVVFSQFNHANISLPAAIERVAGWIFVTPDMHKVHHHYLLPYTDSNYGNIFSIWDRLFGTLRHLPAREVVFGVDTHMEPRDHNHLASLLRIPFREYRKALAPAAEKKFGDD